MKIAIYGDAHITKRMGNIQDKWNESVLSIFKGLYSDFETDNIELAVCLGDLFDKAVLEAKSVQLVTSVLSILNNATFPTYVLLGNHEIDSMSHNILDYLLEYSNIIPVTELMYVEEKFTFVPYSFNLEDLPANMIEDKIIFTHHDIYGSSLAGGKVKASFGVDPNILSGAFRVFNGHIHYPSQFGNIYNVGSITKMHQGEISYPMFPNYYYLDTSTREMSVNSLTSNLILPLTIERRQIEEVLQYYDDSVKFILRVDYDEDSEIEGIGEYKINDRILSIALRKSLKESLGEREDIKRESIDIREFITNYINKDVTAVNKEDLINTGLSILGESKC